MLIFREGQQIGSYTLIRKLGKGGFGEVWLGERRTKFVTTKVAVKLPHDEQVDHEAIRQEATLWEQASGHPNVLPIIDADEYDGQVLIVSEYAPDGSLEQWLKQNGKMTVEEAIETTIQILNGLEFLHSRNIIHRDLKPANILLQGKTPRLADFGISRALRTTVASQSQHISGTFAYMSPEALDGKRSIQTDIWSVGVNLYQFLTGNLPFPQKEPSVLIAAIMMRESEPLPNDIPQDVKNIVAKALAKQPENRYKTASEMREDLKKVLVNVSFPQFAPTEVLHKPILPVIETEKPIIYSDKSTSETNAQSIQTQIQPTQTEKETEQFTRPAIETNQPSNAPSIVTQIKPQQTDETPKPLPTVAQPFADKTHVSRNQNRILYYAGAGFLGLILLLGFFALFNFSGLKDSKQANLSNAVATNTNTPANTAVNTNQRLIPFKKKDRFGFVDENKKLVIEAKYGDAKPFVDGLAIVQGQHPLPYKWGVIDKTGKEVVPLKYDEILPFNEDLARVKLDNKYGFIDKTGKEIISPKYDYAGDYFSEGLVDVIVGDEARYIDKTERVVITIEQPKGHAPFSEGLAAVGNYKSSDYGDYGFIDTTGKTIIPIKYRYVQDFKEGLAPVILSLNNDKYGFMDKTGKLVIQPRFSMAFPFSEGLANVKTTNGKWGFIDKTGKEVIPFKYEWASRFSNGLASVEFEDVYGLIDKTGKEITPFKYASAYPVGDLFFVEYQYGEKDYEKTRFYIDKNGTEYYEP